MGSRIIDRITPASDAAIESDLQAFSQSVDRPLPGVDRTHPVYGDYAEYEDGGHAAPDPFIAFGPDAPYYRRVVEIDRERQLVVADRTMALFHQIMDEIVGPRPVFEKTRWGLDLDLVDEEIRLEQRVTTGKKV